MSPETFQLIFTVLSLSLFISSSLMVFNNQHPKKERKKERALGFPLIIKDGLFALAACRRRITFFQTGINFNRVQSGERLSLEYNNLLRFFPLFTMCVCVAKKRQIKA
jgi:hypothetical protein